MGGGSTKSSYHDIRDAQFHEGREDARLGRFDDQNNPKPAGSGATKNEGV